MIGTGKAAVSPSLDDDFSALSLPVFHWIPEKEKGKRKKVKESEQGASEQDTVIYI